jgi:hypothetical protein
MQAYCLARRENSILRLIFTWLRLWMTNFRNLSFVRFSASFCVLARDSLSKKRVIQKGIKRKIQLPEP